MNSSYSWESLGEGSAVSRGGENSNSAWISGCSGEEAGGGGGMLFVV